jgi:hypothetical protein
MHQYKITSDLFTLGGCVREVYSGHELIDNKTFVEYMDINLWDTMKYSFLGMMQKVETDKNTSETFGMLNDFYSDFIDFIGVGCYFAYDSDKKGPGNPGTNIIKGSIPYKPFYLPEYIKDNVTSALILFEQTCHDIENKYGPIRLFCYPTKIGNKFKIRFKDYDASHYPIEAAPIGALEQDGLTSSSDNGFHVEKQIEEVLEHVDSVNLY